MRRLIVAVLINLFVCLPGAGALYAWETMRELPGWRQEPAGQETSAREPGAPNPDGDPAQQKAVARPTVSITATVEEGKKLLVATVTRDGEPVADVKVAFFAQRTFGLLSLGQDTTLDDGTAAAPFPQSLPGGATGELQFIAEITDPPEFAALRGQATLPGGLASKPVATEPFPRALWAPRAPLPLVLTIGVLVGGVWCTYAYVVVQLMKIRKGAKR
jgi:hypothetical protein